MEDDSLEKIPDGDIEAAIGISDCKNGHISNGDSKGATLGLQTGNHGFIGKIQGRCASLPCQLKMVHILMVLVAAVWGLLSLPIIFYHLPPEEVSINATWLVLHNS